MATTTVTNTIENHTTSTNTTATTSTILDSNNNSRTAATTILENDNENELSKNIFIKFYDICFDVNLNGSPKKADVMY